MMTSTLKKSATSVILIRPMMLVQIAVLNQLAVLICGAYIELALQGHLIEEDGEPVPQLRLIRDEVRLQLIKEETDLALQISSHRGRTMDGRRRTTSSRERNRFRQTRIIGEIMSNMGTTAQSALSPNTYSSSRYRPRPERMMGPSYSSYQSANNGRSIIDTNATAQSRFGAMDMKAQSILAPLTNTSSTYVEPHRTSLPSLVPELNRQIPSQSTYSPTAHNQSGYTSYPADQRSLPSIDYTINRGMTASLPSAQSSYNRTDNGSSHVDTSTLPGPRSLFAYGSSDSGCPAYYNLREQIVNLPLQPLSIFLPLIASLRKDLKTAEAETIDMPEGGAAHRRNYATDLVIDVVIAVFHHLVQLVIITRWQMRLEIEQEAEMKIETEIETEAIARA